jgi:hypothetical protein
LGQRRDRQLPQKKPSRAEHGERNGAAFSTTGAQPSASGASAIALIALSRLGGHRGLAPAVRGQGSADMVDQFASNSVRKPPFFQQTH